LKAFIVWTLDCSARELGTALYSVLFLDNLGIVGFLVCGRMAVDPSRFSIHFDIILSPKYFILKVLKSAILRF
jgi:hypothetical protein